MKRMLSSVLLASLSTISLSSFAEEKPLFTFVGNFAYQISGDFNNPANEQSGKLTEVGVFKSDGHGKITANGFANIVNSDLTTTLASSEVKYKCTYTDTGSAIPYIVKVSCDRYQVGFPTQKADFILSMVRSIGLGKRQFVRILALSGGDFGNVSIIGQANSGEF